MEDLFSRLDKVLMKINLTKGLPWIQRCDFWEGLIKEKETIETEIKKEMLDKAVKAS